MTQLTLEETYAFGFLGALCGGLLGLLCFVPWLALTLVTNVLGGTTTSLVILLAYFTAADRGLRG